MSRLEKIAQFRAGVKSVRLKLGLDTFVIALIGAIVLAYFWSAPGTYNGSITLHDVANYGVSLIFFFYGLKLSPEKFKEGLSNWRLHIVVQTATFIIFPLVVLFFMAILGSNGNRLFWIGTFYLAALPSTVSSSVVMVSIARGNVPSAIFNASISSLLGVFITPVWMGIILTSKGGNYDITNVVLKLSLQVLLPVVLGILLHPKLGTFAERNKGRLKLFDQSIILLIVYTSFCESFANKMFAGYSFAEILILGVAMIALFFLIYGIITLAGRMLHFSVEDHITAVFCGSKKSLVHGTVMSKVLFPGISGVGVILLPLMIFHALQLIAASIIAQRFDKRGKE
ncbi:MAG: bile acid:sodium symporter [Bacteroidales bacterium]|nr:bile acid:sodium symporter [Bacteroidales bacterium]MBN2748909.1 bile acid:sodium symporter [Bacteroidales bacterium]